MAKTVLAKSGLVKQTKGDIGWEANLNDSFQTFEDRLGLTSSGDPNGAKVGNWYGQKCWDTVNSIMYECTRPGPATGASRATWQRYEGVPAGAINIFWRTSLPAGYIGTGQTYNKSAYPGLAAVLPPGIQQTSTTFTFPAIATRGLLFRQTTSLTAFPPTLGSVGIGQVHDEFDIPFVTGSGGNCMIIDALIGIKF